MKILVTGASGFLGKQIVLNLLNRGHNVLALSRNILTITHNNLNQIVGDLNYLSTLKNNYNIDSVIHCAANIKLSDNSNDFNDMLYDNVQSIFYLLEFMKFNKIYKLINSSSTSIYNENYDSSTLINEDFPISPKNNYAITKLMAEYIINNFCKNNNISFVNLRYSSIYGFSQNPTSILPIFINNAINGKPLKIFGTGNRTQDYVNIDDIVNININIIEKNLFSKQIINIGSGEFMTDLQLAKLVIEITKSKSCIEIQNNSNIDSFNTLNISLARIYLDFYPRKLKLGLTSVITNYI